MKRATTKRQFLSLLLTLTLLLTLAPAAQADSPAYGSEVWLRDTSLQDGVVLSDNIFWSDYYAQFRHEYYITYTPGGSVPPAWSEPETSLPEGPDEPEEPSEPDDPGGTDEIPGWLLSAAAQGARSFSASSNGVVPVAYYGSSVCDRTTASDAASYYESLGYRVLGVINGDFYDTATGFPLGMLVSDGELLSSAGGYYAVGFRADGSVVMGQPQLTITAQSSQGSLNLSGLNKPRVERGGVTMLTHVFRNDHTTGASTAGVNVVANIVEGRAAIGGQLILQVAEVAEGSGARTIGEGQVVLTCPANGYEDALNFLRALAPGETITVSFTETSNPAWSEVTEAIGALYLLVENGTAHTDFEVSAAPRTAVGLKANGDLVLYTIDGRQTGHSMGASLGVLAQRMEELGCVTALCLDGGGSTTLVASQPDSGSAQLVNSPSDKSQRRVSNHIALLAPGGATGEARSVNLSLSAPVVLAGHTVTLTGSLADSHYYPMGGEPFYSASAGTISGNLLTAPLESGPVTVTASYGGLSTQQTVLVVDAPDEASIQRDGKTISYLNVTPGETVALGLSALCRHLPMEVSPGDFTWRMTPELGTIDENGVMTAALTKASGYITASRGSCSITIPVAIRADSPFVDMAGHWADEFITTLYYQGILAGEKGADGGLYARPDRAVTRAEFAVLLSRYLGLNTADYANTQTPFGDMDRIDAWARDAVRAMYALGIVNGTTINGEVVFDAQGTLTRAQAVTMLGRLLDRFGGESEPNLPAVPDGGSQFMDLTVFDPDNMEAPPEESAGSTGEASSLALLDQFGDAADVPDYAAEYFAALVELGVINGIDGQLVPNGAMTRAAVCKVLVTMPTLQ